MSITISDKCTGCGACVKDCPTGHLELINGHAATNDGRCLLCAHCVAVCPVSACSIAAYDMSEATPIAAENCAIDADNLLNFMRARKSIRHFTGKPVEEEKLQAIIEAGRYAPTASNLQKNRFVIVREKRDEFKDMVMKQLAKEGGRILDESDDDYWRVRAKIWIDMYDNYKQNPNGKDTLFFNAPAVMVLISSTDRDGGIAASYMELMAAAQGLGMLYSGYTAVAANTGAEIKQLLGMTENEVVIMGMMVGYPDVRYLRVAPRYKANILEL